MSNEKSKLPVQNKAKETILKEKITSKTINDVDQTTSKGKRTHFEQSTTSNKEIIVLVHNRPKKPIRNASLNDSPYDSSSSSSVSCSNWNLKQEFGYKENLSRPGYIRKETSLDMEQKRTETPQKDLRPQKRIFKKIQKEPIGLEKLKKGSLKISKKSEDHINIPLPEEEPGVSTSKASVKQVLYIEELKSNSKEKLPNRESSEPVKEGKEYITAAVLCDVGLNPRASKTFLTRREFFRLRMEWKRRRDMEAKEAKKRKRVEKLDLKEKKRANRNKD